MPGPLTAADGSGCGLWLVLRLWLELRLPTAMSAAVTGAVAVAGAWVRTGAVAWATSGAGSASYVACTRSKGSRRAGRPLVPFAQLRATPAQLHTAKLPQVVANPSGNWRAWPVALALALALASALTLATAVAVA